MAAITLRNGLGRNLTPNEVDANFTALNTENAAQQTAINAKAPINDAALTGTPTAPTPAANDSTTKIATTAFVMGQASDDLPLPVAGTASAGTSTEWARADHVHVGGSGGGSAAQDSLSPGSSTIPPSINAVLGALALKADATTVNSQIDAVNSSLTGGLASKYDSSNLSDQPTAEVGSSNTVLMTPLRTQQLIAAKLTAIAAATTEIMGQTQFLWAAATGVGFTSVQTMGCSVSNIDSSSTTAAAAQQADGSFKRINYRSAASGLNRAAGGFCGNGNMRLTGPGAESVVIGGFADANFASGSIFLGMYEGSTVPSTWVNTNPSAVTTGAYMGVGCDETDTTWKIMWRGNTGSSTKVDTGIARVRHRPVMVYLRPNSDASAVFVRVTELNVQTGLALTTFEYTITTNIYSAGTTWSRGWMRSSLSGVAADGVTAFQCDLLFSVCIGGRLPVLNFQALDTEPTPANRVVTGASTIVGADVGAIINFNSASTAALTLPTDATLGFTSVRGAISIYIAGAGVPTISAASGAVTINGTPPSGLGTGKFIVLMPTGAANTWAYA